MIQKNHKGFISFQLTFFCLQRRQILPPGSAKHVFVDGS